MKRLLLILLVASVLNSAFMLYSKDLKKKHNKVIKETGLVLIDGVPKYFDPNEMNFNPTFILSKNAIEKSRAPVIKSSHLTFTIDSITKEIKLHTEDSEKNDPYFGINESELFYKIENNDMYLSKDKIEWDRLFLKLIDDKPKDPGYWIVVYFKCKYFEGEYVIEH